MNTAIYLATYAGIFALVVFLARRWVVMPPPRTAKIPKAMRIVALIAVGWVGAFASSALAHRTGFWVNDGVAYDEGAEVSYEIMHDGMGDNVLNLVFGWSFGLFAWRAAGLMKAESKERSIEGAP